MSGEFTKAAPSWYYGCFLRGLVRVGHSESLAIEVEKLTYPVFLFYFVVQRFLYIYTH